MGLNKEFKSLFQLASQIFWPLKIKQVLMNGNLSVNLQSDQKLKNSKTSSQYAKVVLKPSPVLCPEMSFV